MRLGLSLQVMLLLMTGAAFTVILATIYWPLAGCRSAHQVVQAQLLHSVLAGLPHAHVVLVVQLRPTQSLSPLPLKVTHENKGEKVGKSRMLHRVDIMLCCAASQPCGIYDFGSSARFEASTPQAHSPDGALRAGRHI